MHTEIETYWMIARFARRYLRLTKVSTSFKTICLAIGSKVRVNASLKMMSRNFTLRWVDVQNRR